MALRSLYTDGKYAEIILSQHATKYLAGFVEFLVHDVGAQLLHNSIQRNEAQTKSDGDDETALYVGLSALAAFLQANVTGPVLDKALQIEHAFRELEKDQQSKLAEAFPSLRIKCMVFLDTDGVSAYSYISHVELFCLARWVFVHYLSEDGLPFLIDHGGFIDNIKSDPAERSLAWMRLRIHTWHFKLLIEPNAGPGSMFNKMTQWSDLPSLQEAIQSCLETADLQILGLEEGQSCSSKISWSRQAKVQFLMEKANVFSMLGKEKMAQDALAAASKLSGFEYALSGALGKRTRFQEKSTSQLVVLAKSATDATNLQSAAGEAGTAIPQALPLNNDTLLESVDFSDARRNLNLTRDEDLTRNSGYAIPNLLQHLAPDDQPSLSPLDQIILLCVATMKDAFSPADSLTLEEILPFAMRVLSDKPTNWQIYSQALIVRSRIEMHRSRTVERAVLQMQAVVDQVVVDTMGGDGVTTAAEDKGIEHPVPGITVTPADVNHAGADNKPTSFFPLPEKTEKAPAQIRLRYVNALSTPPRWHLEAELAFAWAGVGSLISALEIFKRLRLWAEVALCLASSAAGGGDGGRWADGEEKARAILRWQLFQATDASKQEPCANGEDGNNLDVFALRAADFQGPERTPPPTNAPRLLCILGDIESDTTHYERAWELSKHRYSRAQSSLGESYIRQRYWEQARDAYRKAVEANRLNSQWWSRLGDIYLRLGAFADAADAFSHAISEASDAAGGEDARTWSNLGSALYSLYSETINQKKQAPRRLDDGDKEQGQTEAAEVTADDAGPSFSLPPTDKSMQRNPGMLLGRSLAAFKRGAALSHGNWRIWDNVVTIASRVRPVAVSDIVFALRNVVDIRKSEDAVDADVVRLLLEEAVLHRPKPGVGGPARGSLEKSVCDLIEDKIVPLITTRSDLWSLVVRERAWLGNLAGAIDASEKSWRAAIGGASNGLLGSTASQVTDEEYKRNWLENSEAWEAVVQHTDELVSVLENYGMEVDTVGSRWKPKARSALRSVMSRGKERWEDSAGWKVLQRLSDGLK